MHRMQNGHRIWLADIDELAAGQTKEFSFNVAGYRQCGFLLRTDQDYFAYLNRCPHTGASLNWRPNQFLSLDATQIKCATHDARFNLRSGHCESGPCVGQALCPLQLVISRTSIFLSPPSKIRN